MTVRRWIITITACLVVASALAYYKVRQIQAAIEFGKSFPEPSETVEAYTVKSAPVIERISVVGDIVAPQTLQLRNELEGRISALHFGSGAKVSKDQVLLELDISEEQARLKAAQARLKLARLDLERIRQLIKNQTVSEERLNQADAEFHMAQADIEALKAVIAKKTLTAPFDAVTGIHQLEEGEYLGANTMITTLVGVQEDTWVDFNLPPQRSHIAVGTEVRVTLPERSELLLEGKIIARDSVISVDSRNRRFRALINNSEQLPPNTRVNVEVIINVSAPIAQIPATALRMDALGEHVYQLVLQEDNQSYRAQRVNISSGVQEGDSVAVPQGLDDGMIIAAEGAFKLRNNLLVFIRTDSGD